MAAWGCECPAPPLATRGVDVVEVFPPPDASLLVPPLNAMARRIFAQTFCRGCRRRSPRLGPWWRGGEGCAERCRFCARRESPAGTFSRARRGPSPHLPPPPRLLGVGGLCPPREASPSCPSRGRKAAQSAPGLGISDDCPRAKPCGLHLSESQSRDLFRRGVLITARLALCGPEPNALTWLWNPTARERTRERLVTEQDGQARLPWSFTLISHAIPGRASVHQGGRGSTQTAHPPLAHPPVFFVCCCR
ncbi:hypothetical protein LY76DRAFT_592575 [Colletotrichum caudatum]|nr:hypothetical protein LY76DRAFT_592575 [Colletotrichum caudatum]